MCHQKDKHEMNHMFLLLLAFSSSLSYLSLHPAAKCSTFTSFSLILSVVHLTKTIKLKCKTKMN